MKRSAITRLAAGCLPVLVAGVAACGPGNDAIDFAEAEIAPLGGSGVEGVVRFSDQTGYLRVTGTLSGLAPGEHELYVYEAGTCDRLGDGSDGSVVDDWRVSDLASAAADRRGRARIDTADTRLPANEGTTDLLGQAIVVSVADADTPSACGTVQAVPQPDYTL